MNIGEKVNMTTLRKKNHILFSVDDSSILFNNFRIHDA